MREISFSEIEQVVATLSIKANKELPCSLCDCIEASSKSEEGLSKEIMEDLVRNIDAAKEIDVPICQDTGMAVVFVELGQDVHITGGLLTDAINSGVAKGYTDGLLRKSVVLDPLHNRIYTGDNTPAIIHIDVVAGDQIKIDVCPKGFGSENMSQLSMKTPAASVDDIVEYVVSVVRNAGSNPCPPIVIGVGIGGDFEQCALLSKRALCRDVAVRHADPFYAELEQTILERVNALQIGPQGFGGKTTALAVNIETAPTHIAGLPVAVNIGCHVTRHATATI